jgi:uncharacterized protein (TIGR04552 family)
LTGDGVREQLTGAELEVVRLILRGGSVVDWYRLKMEASGDVRAFLQLQGAEAGDDVSVDDRVRLAHLRDVAAAYLQDEHGYRISDEMLACDPTELFLFASEKRGRRRDRFLACLLLKVMHIVHHIEARELRFYLPLSQSQLADLLVEKVDAFARTLKARGFPLVSYAGGQKSLTSVITKLMMKKEHHAATIHDRVRFRFVVEEPRDLIDLLRAMTRDLFPFNYAAPGQTVNQLVNFTALVEGNEFYRSYASELQIELGDEDLELKHLNENSGPSYRVINFVVDVPIRVPDDVLAHVQKEGQGLGRVVFGLAEFQIVDRQSDVENERGENRHDRYRARQLGIVRERLERGKRARDDDKS